MTATVGEKTLFFVPSKVLAKIIFQRLADAGKNRLDFAKEEDV